MLSGGCFCGAVRYEAGGEPFHSTLCHCADCRHVAGAPAVAWFSVRVSGFRITHGAAKRFQSSDRVTRQFCNACGTGLTFQHADLPDEIDVTTCSLDKPELVAPVDQSFVRSRLRWMATAASLPEDEKTGD